MSPLLSWLLIVPGTFLVLPLLSVATGWVCARRMQGVSYVFGLLAGGACGVVVGYLMFYRAQTLLWVDAQFEVVLPWGVIVILSLALAVAGIGATWGMCRLRQMCRLPQAKSL